MYRLTVLYPPPRDPVHFREYYLSTHVPLAVKLPGLQSSWYTLDVAAVEGESPVFAIWEGEFESVEAMVAAIGSPEGQAVVADVPNYATGGAQIIHYAPVVV
ncbi:EthD family reductase [Mycolicibacterium llatzerense]|uniref:EthD family reductase n=1 Tax=Mycolicibacterium llatzerense TaxID=280871 RepID=UPI0008DC78BB|nr:EthD family reductase [Mycolicibacterium llatzerense]